MPRIPVCLCLVALAGCSEVPTAARPQDCVRPDRVAAIGFSATKYPHIRRHFRRAVRRGWPRVLVLRRTGADDRRAALLDAYPTREGYDRDEYPPAVGRAVLGIKLRRFCDGTRFRYVFY